MNETVRKVFWTAVAGAVLMPWRADAGPGGSGGGGSTNFGFSLPNPFSAGTSLYDFILTVINEIVLPIGAIIVVIFIIYSGYLFVTAAGNEAQLKRAKDNFLWVVVGTAVLLGAWVIAEVIKNTIDNLRA